jgi:hypothetical protein
VYGITFSYTAAAFFKGKNPPRLLSQPDKKSQKKTAKKRPEPDKPVRAFLPYDLLAILAADH